LPPFLDDDDTPIVPPRSTFLKVVEIAVPPKCLCLHIQRTFFVGKDLVKDGSITLFAKSLSLKCRGGGDVVKYELSAIVEHFGRRSRAGHFIAYKRLKLDDAWLRCSDEMVKEVSWDEVALSKPYLLFYESVNLLK